MLLDEDFIRELTQVVWTTVLGLELEPIGPGLDDDKEITTSVDITGAWSGTISLSFSRHLGRHLAASMLACPESETTPALITDVVGELANVIGGNVKGVLPGPCRLSLPRVEGVEANGATQSRGPAQRLWFDCAGQPFTITVHSSADHGGMVGQS